MGRINGPVTRIYIPLVSWFTVFHLLATSLLFLLLFLFLSLFPSLSLPSFVLRCCSSSLARSFLAENVAVAASRKTDSRLRTIERRMPHRDRALGNIYICATVSFARRGKCLVTSGPFHSILPLRATIKDIHFCLIARSNNFFCVGL